MFTVTLTFRHQFLFQVSHMHPSISEPGAQDLGRESWRLDWQAYPGCAHGFCFDGAGANMSLL